MGARLRGNRMEVYPHARTRDAMERVGKHGKAGSLAPTVDLGETSPHVGQREHVRRSLAAVDSGNGRFHWAYL